MIGNTLAHYKIVASLGKGGMGEVYVAEDTRLHRRIALKVLPEEMAADPERRARFEREARAVAALNHPNIVTIHSVEEADGVHFITMELVEGRTLSEMLPRDGFPLGDLLGRAIPLADAVSSAHQKGITHRDLKPDNVMVDGEGRLKVLDFGLAKLHDRSGSDDGLTEAPTATLETGEGKILGTVAYMSPEQAEGKVVDSRSDIFSLGTILYEMATGERPFRGDTSMSTISSILKDEPTAVSEINRSLPRHLGRIIRRCLAKDPNRRYQTALDLRNELEELKAEVDSGAAPSATTARPDAVGSGRRWVWALGAVIALLVVILGATVLRRSAEREAPHGTTVPAAGVVLGEHRSSSRGPKIAVLPFADAGGDPDQEYFGDGLTGDIITELSRYRELAVLAHSSTARYKGGEVDVREVGSDLDARYVLQGSVSKTGERIRIRVQLSDTSDGRMVWGTNYERVLTARDLFELQDELTQQVVNAIAGSYGALARAELPRARRKAPASLDSYDCVLRTYEYLQVHSPANHLAARRCLEQVVESDPDYAAGKAWLAYLYAEEHHHRWNERPAEYDALDRALALAEEAVRVDDASHVSHGALMLTHFLRGENERGRIEAFRTIELSPNDALWLALTGTYLAQLEDFENGVPMVRKAIALSPHPPPWYGMAAFYDHYHHGRYEEALAEAKRLNWEGDFREPLFVAATYGQLGQPGNARQSLDELSALWPRPDGDLRLELVERHALSPALADHLVDGLEKAGLDITSIAR
jgi:non-specific serine/threonine protein kinase